MPRVLIALVASALLFTGCDLAEDDFEAEVVVEGFLVAGELMPAFRLSETAPIEIGYVFEERALSDAEVTVTLVDGFRTEVYELIENPDFPGNYVVPFSDEVPRVVPGALYVFEARLPDRSDLVPIGEMVSAQTLVPDTFSVVRPPPDTLLYDVLRPGPAIDVTPSTSGDRQAVYIFSVTSLDPQNYDLTPTLADLVEETEAEPGDFVNSASPLLNEDNYEQNPDGTITIRVPWLAVSFYGPNVFTANTVDDALFDYLRSRDAQFNPTTLSPGEIQRVISNVENGTGVFGSIARVSVETFIAEPGTAP